MNNLYYIYLLKRHYLLPLNSLNEDSDLDDYRVYTVYDYVLAVEDIESFKVLEGPYKETVAVKGEYYYDEEYLAFADKEVVSQEDLETLRENRNQKLFKYLGKYYMKAYGLFFIVKDEEAIANIQELLSARAKKSKEKVLNFSDYYRKF